MAKMHSRARGKAKSRKPAGRPKQEKAPSAKKVEELVVKLAKEKVPAAKIGQRLKDQEGVLDVKAITGKRITKILEDNKVAPELPEDLLNLMRKSVLLRKHLTTNIHDQPAKRGLTLTDSKIMRLAKYYKTNGRIPHDWKFSPQKYSYLAE